jgi:hypothetical protein
VSWSVMTIARVERAAPWCTGWLTAPVHASTSPPSPAPRCTRRGACTTAPALRSPPSPAGTLNSHRFALLTAAALTARGIPVVLYSRFAFTPLVPFGIVHTGAVAGVMVTASHNPKQDNGYKVYAGNGAQIVSPVDKRIATAILGNLEPWADVRYGAGPACDCRTCLGHRPADPRPASRYPTGRMLASPPPPRSRCYAGARLMPAAPRAGHCTR